MIQRLRPSRDVGIVAGRISTVLLRSDPPHGARRHSSTIKRLSSRPSSPLTPLSSKVCHGSAPHHQITHRRSSSDDASTSTGELNRTALHDLHVKYGGKMVPFGGFSMPVQYSDLSVGESHKWTREKASLFDVGHMYVLLCSKASDPKY